MKIKLIITLTALSLAFSNSIFSQVGIGTTTPVSSAELDVTSTTKGFLPPRMTQAQKNAIVSPAAGLMVWCTDCGNAGEAQVFNGTAWTNLIGGVQVGSISTLSCGSATNNGSLMWGVVASGVSSEISYNNGNAGPHNGQTVTSTGVTGLTATAAAGNFAPGNGSLTYTITGTPSSSGTASFAINIGGQTCALTRTVSAGAISTINCAGATANGTLVNGVVASSVNSVIPYTGGNLGSHSGQTVTSTGVTGLTATLAAGTFANGNGTLTYTITGTPASSGTASFAISIGGQTCALTRTVNAGAISTINCAGATANGTLVNGVVASSVNSVIPYTGGNAGPHSGQIVTSTGVTGLTATLSAGTFASGIGTLTYTITGTPASSGTASFAINIGGQTCALTRAVNTGLIATITCGSATNNGTLVNGVVASSVNSDIPYTGGNAGPHSGQIVTSTGVTGLTATLAAGTFASGIGSLTYTITGTPTSSGTASFAINIGGQTCALTRAVNAGLIATITCGSAINNGTLVNGVVASSVNSDISYTGGNAGSHSGQTVTSTGVTGLTATLAAGTFANGNGTLTYTITGTPASSGTASFAISIGGQTCALTRTVNAGAISTINCAGATNNGTLVNGVVASSVNSIIPYTGGNLGSHSGQTVTSTGVTGLTATLSAGTFANGSSSLTYTIAGTPSSVGTASFAINIGGQTCTLTRTSTSPALPANITLSPISSYLIASVYDLDYLPYTAPTTTATLATAQAANGSSETAVLNVQGTLTTTGVTIKIPYTVVTASVTLPAHSQTINIPASSTQDGIARDVVFSYPGGTYAVGTGMITATLKSLIGALNVKMLDVQTGIGNDGLGVLLAQFMYSTNSSGGFDNMDFRAIAGIPDRAMGQTINGANNHNFLYMPKADANGKIWLNNNLGANYSNTAHASFNLAQQAISTTDLNAYGSLYQWGRLSDGHELMTYPTNITFSPVNTSVTSLSTTDNPSSNNFFKTIAAPDDWRSGQNPNLWQGVNGINNPCPIGFRIATFTELNAERASWSPQSASGALNSPLKFTMSGHRYQDGTGATTGNHGYLWTSTINSTNATAIWFNATAPNASSGAWVRAFAYGVRCIKD